MTLVAIVVAVLAFCGVLDVAAIIAAANENKPLAVLVVLAMFVLKGVSFSIPHGVVLVGSSLVFPLRISVPLNLLGSVLTLSISYCVGKYTKSLSYDGILEKYPKLKRYFANASDYSFTFCYAAHSMHLPTEVQGVLFGLLRTPYLAYISSSMLALFPSTMCYTVIGDKFDFSNPLFWLFIGLDVIVVLTGIYYFRKHIIKGGKKDA